VNDCILRSFIVEFLLAEVFITIFLIVGFIFFFKKKFCKITLFGLALMIFLFGIFAAKLVTFIPVPKEPVTITAMNEKNAESSQTQIAILSINVDNKEYKLENASEGKWFWRGDDYYWRPDSDSRRPDGLTQTIVMDIPIGNNRIISFGQWPNRGIVKVVSGDSEQIVDTYGPVGSKTVDVVLQGTEAYKIICFNIFKLTIYGLIIVLLTVYPVFSVQRFGMERIKGWFKRNWDKIYYLTIALLYIVLLQGVSSEGSFWCDEVWQLGWIYTEYPSGSGIISSTIDRFWFNIMPYGQENLRLLSQILVAISIFINGLIGVEYKSKRFGILLSSSVAFSLTIVNQCGMCIRNYASLLLAFSLMLLIYLKKQKYIGNEKIGILLLFGISVACTMDIHQFGFIAACLFLLSDFILIILKTSSKKAWVEFIIPTIYGIYWLVNTWSFNADTFNNYSWAGNATLLRLFECVRWLFCYSNVLLSMFILGTIIIIFNSIVKINYHKFDLKNDYALLTITLIPLLLIAVTFFYSTVINPKNSLFIDRYFISVIVALYFVMCYGIDEVITYIGAAVGKKTIEYIFVIFVICLMCIYNWSQISPWDKWAKSYRTANTDFKSTIEYVMNQNDAYDKKTLYIMDIHNAYGGIGIKYYIMHKGERDDINHCSMVDIPNNIDEYSTLYISYLYKGERYNSELNKIIDEQFKLVSDDKTAKVKKYTRKQ